MKKAIFMAFVALSCALSAHAQTTSVIPLTNPRIQYGATYANYCLYSYSAGTTSPLATFADYSGGTQNSDPVILDANGSATAWLGPYSYKLVLYSNGTSVTQGNNCYGGTLQWTSDNVPGAGISTVSQAWSAITAATNSNAGTFALSGNTLDLNAASAFKVPISAGAAPTTSGLIAYDSTANKFAFGVNGATKNFAIASAGACSAGQFVSSPATATTAAGCSAPSLTGSTCTNCTINGSSTFTGSISSATIGSSTISSSTISSSTISNATLTGGVSNNGSGFKHIRIEPTCSTSIFEPYGFSACDVGVSWPTAFADANYTLSCTMGDTNFNEPIIVMNYYNKTASGVIVTILDLANGNFQGGLDCIAVHD